MTEQPPAPSTGFSRRSVVRTAAWTVPAISLASAAPACASSVTCEVGVPVQYINRAWTRPWTDANLHEFMRWNEMTTPGTPLPAGITSDDVGSYHAVYTGWLGSTPAGDTSPLVTASDYAGGPVNREGFASGADNGRTTDTSFAVTYQFPVKAGATYALDTEIWANAGYLFSQQLTGTYSGPGVDGEFAKITSSAEWNNAPTGFDPVAGKVNRGDPNITPTTNGILTVTFLFNLSGLASPWPSASPQQNGDISISAPTLTPAAGC